MTAVGAAGAAGLLVPFDPTRPVGEGVTVLEASAGTGKTHAVASLVVAEVARGRPLDELLVVTFTRKATGTLRERVWQRLAAAVAALDPAAPEAADDLHRHLATGSPDEVAHRRVLLARALSDFDATTIATTHGFCQQVLVSLGVAGDAERNVELLEDVGDLVDDAVDDLFVRRFHAGGDVPFDRAAARRIARAVVENPDAEIAHVDRDLETDVQRRRFADTLRRRIAEQKRRGRLITFDDLLGRLDRSLADAVRGDLVAERLRRRFSMAVVDEFQDTDTVQWRILRSAFGTPPSRLVLVGDPKQAIYAFRGGDVHAYREATAAASTTLGLGVSWRSDQRLLDGIDALLAGAHLGGPGIVHRPLLARPGAEAPRLLGGAAGAPLTVRIVDRRSGRITCTRNGWAEKSSTRRFIADDVAGEATRLLTSGCEIVDRDGAGTATHARPLGPDDLAVLVRSHRDAETVRQALVAAGVPAVVHGGTEVIRTDAGQAWLDLLRALEQPSATRVRTVVAGPFFGWDGRRLATAPDADWDQVDEWLHEWAAALRTSGVAAVVHRIEATAGLTARLLGETGGQRRLSDLRHVAELLHARHAAHPASAASLAGWLAEQRAATTVGEAARRRLESDAPAVTVQTIHGAKGLEFPVVLLPSLWEGPWADEDDPPIFHDDQGVRCIGVGSQGEIHRAQVAAAAHERAEEELRLLYVALTRARHRVVLWWATASDAGAAPLARILLGQDPATGAVRDELGSRPTEDAIRRELEARAAAGAGAVAVEDASGLPPEPLPPPAAGAGDLRVKVFGRVLDDRWVRTSYSGLTAAAHDALVPTEPPAPAAVEAAEVDERAKVDEPAMGSMATSGAGADALAAPVPLSDVLGGARVGSLVHEILESTDFASSDLAADLAAAAAQTGAARLLGTPADLLVAGLVAALSTPLGPLMGERRLRDLTPVDRLDELSFDLPLAGGDSPTGVVTMAAVADVFAAHLRADGLLGGYADRLRDPLLSAEVRGFLTGSIDLVARVDGRHVVIDYKTNRLAPPDEPVTPWHYRPEALAAAMQDAHYPLQAAVYAVALHRYLRWRLPGYDPARHLGGAAYLFLRGMTGEGSPRFDGHPSGVFSWPMPVAFVTDLSDLFDRGIP
jgi:exodeoxyribonuclease V beta subunit